MSVVVTVEINGAGVPLTLGDEQLAQIAASLPVAEEPVWPEWMSVETAAHYLGFSVERLRKLKERGGIPYYQEGPGCRVFFKRTDLDDWMENQRRGGDA